MYKNAESLLLNLVRAHRNSHFNLFDIPFLPCTLVQPQPAVIDPFFTGSFDTFQRFQYHIETNDMRTMWIGKISRAVYLLRFYFSQQLHSDLNILFTHRLFLDGTCLIKRKVLKMDILFLYSYISAGSSFFTTPDQALDRAHSRRVDLV